MIITMPSVEVQPSAELVDWAVARARNINTGKISLHLIGNEDSFGRCSTDVMELNRKPSNPRYTTTASTKSGRVYGLIGKELDVNNICDNAKYVLRYYLQTNGLELVQEEE